MAFKFNPEKIYAFHHQISVDEFNRYNSWRYCFAEFNELAKEDSHYALHLAFYLASWGMYRGSSKLLQKDFKIHIGAIKILRKYYYLKCNIYNEVDQSMLNNILELIEELRKYYKSFGISPTDTLISKILLGTLGCSPAFDRYFLDGVRHHKLNFKSPSEKNFKLLFQFASDNRMEIEDLQNNLLENENIFYPKFKLIDMFFWHEGYESEKSKKIK